MKLSRIDYIGLNGGDGEHYTKMTDIVERLRMDADNANPYCIDQDSIMEAADTIENLRAELKVARDNLEIYCNVYDT